MLNASANVLQKRSDRKISEDTIQKIRCCVQQVQAPASCSPTLVCTPDEIGSIVGWLAGDQSGFTTGADFSCNGGLHMG